MSLAWWKGEGLGRIESPAYVYNRSSIRQQCRSVEKAIEDTTLLYALKANSHPCILSQMKQEGLVKGVDVASVGEVNKALDAGFLPEEMSVTGPSKPIHYLKRLLDIGVGTICVESIDELKRICALGGMSHGGILLRINPIQEIRAFQLKISGRANPFGVDEEDLDEILSFLLKHRTLLPFRGIHVHAGSQCFSARGFALHAEVTFALARRVESYGLPVEVVNLGGGIGYGNWLPHKRADVWAFGKQLSHVRMQSSFSGEVRLEPGRFLVAPSGVYATPICRVKKSRGMSFVIMEGGINHLFALSHPGYQKKQIWVEKQQESVGELRRVQLVGSLCTPVDALGGLVELAEPRSGDVLLFPNNGAYGLSMSPTRFLSHPLPEERFVDIDVEGRDDG